MCLLYDSIIHTRPYMQYTRCLRLIRTAHRTIQQVSRGGRQLLGAALVLHLGRKDYINGRTWPPEIRRSASGHNHPVTRINYHYKLLHQDHVTIKKPCVMHDIQYVYMAQPWAAPPPPGDGHGSLPRPLWEWVGWLWMGGNAG